MLESISTGYTIVVVPVEVAAECVDIPTSSFKTKGQAYSIKVQAQPHSEVLCQNLTEIPFFRNVISW